MGEISREGLASRIKAVWLWALLGSLVIHSLLLAMALSWKSQAPLKARCIVPVEPIILTEVSPGPTGGGGGQPAEVPKAAPLAPKPIPKPKPKPTPKRRFKPQVRKKVKKTKRVAVTATPPPLALALPKPAPLSKGPTPGGASATLRRSYGTGSGQGGSGGGRGRGSGPGLGRGQGPGSGAGSLLSGYLQKIRRLLERQKAYPRMARRLHLQGVAVLQFTIAADGRIETTRLKRSSGHGLLDTAAQETVRRVGKFPPIPAALGRKRLSIRIPLAFRLTD